MNATIYHNPKCGTSRNALQILRESGIEPEIIEYLKTPLSCDELAALAKKLGGASVLLRTKEILVAELGLEDAAEATILDAIAAHPILLNRPLVITDKGARFCRPAELVREII